MIFFSKKDDLDGSKNNCEEKKYCLRAPNDLDYLSTLVEMTRSFQYLMFRLFINLIEVTIS